MSRDQLEQVTTEGGQIATAEHQREEEAEMRADYSFKEFDSKRSGPCGT